MEFSVAKIITSKKKEKFSENKNIISREDLMYSWLKANFVYMTKEGLNEIQNEQYKRMAR